MPEKEGNSQQVSDWLKQAASGDQDAKQRILVYFGAHMRSQAKRMLQKFPRVRRWADTNDVYQGAMSRLVKAMMRVEFQSEEHFLNLAARLIRFELLDLARFYGKPMPLGGRHDSHIRHRDDLPPAHEAADSRFDPNQLVAWSEFHEMVSSLPDDERTLVECLWYLGLGQAETARRLGVSESTVKRRWSAIKDRLGESLKDIDLGR